MMSVLSLQYLPHIFQFLSGNLHIFGSNRTCYANDSVDKYN